MLMSGYQQNITRDIQLGIIAAEKVFLLPTHSFAAVTIERTTVTDECKSAIRQGKYEVNGMLLKTTQLLRFVRRICIDKPATGTYQEAFGVRPGRDPKSSNRT